MPTSFEQLHLFNEALQQLECYIREEGIKMPLMVLIGDTPEGINAHTVMDVKYESYSIHVDFPNPILEIRYTGVQHTIVGDRFHEVGAKHVKLELGRGRVLFERVKVSELPQVQPLQRIDVHV